MPRQTRVTAKIGDRFTVNVNDGVVLMEATGIRCGDVWDCHPVQGIEKGYLLGYAQEYGEHMVFTDEQVVRMTARHQRTTAARRDVWPPR